MGLKFTITEEEKNKILSKYGILNESKTETCDSGDCVNGTGTKTTEFSFTNNKGTKLASKEVFTGTFKDGNYLNGTLKAYQGNFTKEWKGSFENNRLQGSGTQTSINPGKYESVYDGDFSDGYFKSGTATFNFDKDGNNVKLTVKSNNITKGSDFNNAEIKFENGEEITGLLIDEGSDLQFNNGKGYWTHFLVNDYIEGKIPFTSGKVSGDSPTKSKTETSTSDGEMPVITDEMRKKWKGCIGTVDKSIFHFDGINGSKDYGYLPEMPELGMAKFEGVVDGKNIKVHACFDKFKLINTLSEGETGERGDFDGFYDTGNEKNDTFEGTEENANKFRYGLFKNSKDYKFHNDEWEYEGKFKDGVIDTTYGGINFSDLSTYDGAFVNGKIKGKGEFRFADGGIYSGNFEQYTNTEGNETYKVSLENGKIIDDLLKYHKGVSKTPLSNKEVDDTIGIVKGSTIEGQTFFKQTFHTNLKMVQLLKRK